MNKKDNEKDTMNTKSKEGTKSTSHSSKDKSAHKSEGTKDKK